MRLLFNPQKVSHHLKQIFFFMALVLNPIPFRKVSAHSQLICEPAPDDMKADFLCGEQHSCAGFTLAQGPASSDTDIWVLGEFHTNPEITRTCIAELAALRPQAAVHVYLEDVPLGKSTSCTHNPVVPKQNNLQCHGWDDKEAMDEFLEILKINGRSAREELSRRHMLKGYLTVIENSIYQSIRQEVKQQFPRADNKLVDVFMDQHLSSIKALLNSETEFAKIRPLLHKQANREKMLGAVKYIEQQRKEGASYSDIFKFNVYSEPARVKNLEELIKVKTLSKKRDESLLKTIQKTANETRRNKKQTGSHHRTHGQMHFFIAGTEHVEATRKKIPSNVAVLQQQKL